MNYIKVKWNHALPDEPVWFYSELDAERWETRKVEIFADGSCVMRVPQTEAGRSAALCRPRQDVRAMRICRHAIVGYDFFQVLPLIFPRFGRQPLEAQ
jgi:hypothetical protein